MKNQPEKIYLQASGNDFEDNEIVSWCDSKIEEDNLEYIRKDIITIFLKDLKAHSLGYEPGKNIYKRIEKFLTELK